MNQEDSILASGSEDMQEAKQASFEVLPEAMKGDPQARLDYLK